MSATKNVLVTELKGFANPVIARRLKAAGARVIGCDPSITFDGEDEGVETVAWGTPGDVTARAVARCGGRLDAIVISSAMPAPRNCSEVGALFERDPARSPYTVPQRVLAKLWLKGRANPPQAVQWQPSTVWISCDGSAGVTFGAFQGNGAGWFSTVWQRQKKGDYKWVLDQGGDLAAPLAGADFITGKD